MAASASPAANARGWNGTSVDSAILDPLSTAHHSRARGSVNVPVDYTLAKNVWRPKGGKAGAVNYSDQKTVFVDAEVARQ